VTSFSRDIVQRLRDALEQIRITKQNGPATVEQPANRARCSSATSPR
jgi:hypothetical protein